MPPHLNQSALSFLARHGLADARPEAMPGDASARRYWRLPIAGLLLMEDCSDPVEFASYIWVARHLTRLGLSAPKLSGTVTDIVTDKPMSLGRGRRWVKATGHGVIVTGYEVMRRLTIPMKDAHIVL